MLNSYQALKLCLQILSIGLAIGSLEELKSFYVHASRGLLSSSICLLNYRWSARGLLAKLFKKLFSDSIFRSLIKLKFIGAIGLFLTATFGGYYQLFLVWELLLMSCLSLKSLYGLDGAFQMNQLVLIWLFLASFFNPESPEAFVCYSLISAQVMLSYFIAGIRKWQSPLWRSSVALKVIFATEAYGSAHISKLIHAHSSLTTLLSYVVFVFETLFFLIILCPPKIQLILLALAGSFHLFNALFMGLNSFMFSFLATYPLLLITLNRKDLIEKALELSIYYLIPVFLMSYLVMKKRANRMHVIIFSCLTLTYCLDLFFVGAWSHSLFGYFSRYALLLAMSICLVLAFSKLKKQNVESASQLKFSSKTLLAIIPCFLIGLFSWETYGTLQAKKRPSETLNLSFPLKGNNFCITHGGQTLDINHHSNVSAQKFALDIVQLNSWGFRKHESEPFIEGSNVFSPLSGVVIDLNKDPHSSHPAGCYIVLQEHEGSYGLVLAHLQAGSLSVEIGDVIQEGSYLGKVGSTGRSSEAHLHIHGFVIEEGKDYFFDAKPIALSFSNRYLTRNSMVTNE